MKATLILLLKKTLILAIWPINVPAILYVKLVKGKSPPIHSQSEPPVRNQSEPQRNDEVLYKSNPSMFKNRPILFTVCFFFPFFWPILFIWWFKCIGSSLTITGNKVSKREGVFSKHTNEIYHENIENIWIDQSFFQRIFGVGKVSIASGGTGVVTIEGIPNPNKVRIILEERKSSRLSR